jgi:DNA-binding response OmpR family regulator
MARVLVVDDDPLFRDLFKDSLEFEGVEVEVAESGRKAVEIIMANPPDVVLLDLKMPGVSGYDIIRWVRNDRAYEQVKLVIVTGQTSFKSTPEAKMVDAVCIKPLAITTLVEQVKILMVESV